MHSMLRLLFFFFSFTLMFAHLFTFVMFEMESGTVPCCAVPLARTAANCTRFNWNRHVFGHRPTRRLKHARGPSILNFTLFCVCEIRCRHVWADMQTNAPVSIDWRTRRISIDTTTASAAAAAKCKMQKNKTTRKTPIVLKKFIWRANWVG